jgi:NADH-quinone oxidoreductase subunit C
MTPGELMDAVNRLDAVIRAEVSLGLLTVDVAPEDWVSTLAAARTELGCDFFDWLSAVDEPPDGIDVVCHLASTSGHHHLIVRTRCPDGDLRLGTATGVFRGASWHERETWEMFGIVFDGHPNLVPLLLPDGFEGRPLRKDFVLASRVVKAWPGQVEPGQSGREVTRRKRRNLPLGVPDPDQWGPS